VYDPIGGTQLQDVQKIIGGYSDEVTFSPASSLRAKWYARHISISGSHCASRRAGQKDFLHYQHWRAVRRAG